MLFSASEVDEGEREEKERKCACNKRLQLAKAVLSLEIEERKLEPIYEWEIICNYDNTSQQDIHSSTFELRCFDARLSYRIHSINHPWSLLKFLDLEGV